ncbi:ATPase [Peptoniphilus sp. GNH]|nr:hypothetical protein HMPREF3189_00026 [Clostridiales bacterium KA00134]UHR02996.1 ATPase [Peptoniphilus sp. GNH]
MDVLDLVNELEELIKGASSLPLTGKVMVDKEEVIEILNDLNRELPDEVRQARSITTEKENIISSAKAEAENMINEAKQKAEDLLNQDELVLQANERAAEILKNAKEEATQVREGARDYADSLLENTQVNLSNIIKMLNENRQELRG